MPESLALRKATTNDFRENMTSIEDVKYELATTSSLTCVFIRAKVNIDGPRYLASLLIVTSTYTISQMMTKRRLKNFFSVKEKNIYIYIHSQRNK